MRTANERAPAGKCQLNRSSNGINYLLVFEPDGWVSIYELNDGLPPTPVIQARSLEKAEEYIYFREPLNVPVTRLC